MRIEGIDKNYVWCKVMPAYPVDQYEEKEFEWFNKENRHDCALRAYMTTQMTASPLLYRSPERFTFIPAFIINDKAYILGEF
jgi:hypothetical protein